MARWSDVYEAERNVRGAVKRAANAEAESEIMRAFLRETRQVDAYMQWYAKRLGFLDEFYGDSNSPSQVTDTSDGTAPGETVSSIRAAEEKE